MKTNYIFKNIPEELRERNQWLLWKLVIKNGKPTKVPYSVRGGHAKVNDTSTWSTFASTVEKYEGGGYEGIGFMFSEDDPYTGIDIDKCFNDGQPASLAMTIINAFDSYTEYSPSGNGFHIIVKGKKPADKSKFKDRRLEGIKEVEIYDQGRYFTFTGAIYLERPIEERQDKLDRFYWTYHVEEKKPIQSAQVNVRDQMDDAEVLKKMFNSKNGDKIKRLFDGHIDDYNGDHSSADQALCNYLAYFTGGNAAQMDLIFHQSGLFRDKWDERHYSDGRTYGEVTIQKAIDGIGKNTVNHILPQHGTRGNEDIAPILPEELPEIMLFPVDALPKVMRNYCEQAAESILTPVDYIATPALTLAGGLIGNSQSIEGKPGWTERALLYSAVVGNAGSAKSHALKAAAAPVYAIQKRYADEFERKKEDHAADLIEWEKEVNEAKKAKEPKPPKPLPPQIDRLYAKDITIEKLAVLMDANPRTFLMVHDEIHRWLESMGQYTGKGNADMYQFLSIWSGDPLVVDRMGRESIFIQDPFLAITGCMTPSSIKDFAAGKKRENGFFDRFLISYPEGRKRYLTETMPTIDPQVKSEYHDLLTQLFNVSFSDKPIPLSRDARLKFIDYANQLTAEGEASGSAIIESILSKYQGVTLRIALILHMCDYVTAAPFEKEKMMEVELTTVEQAIKITEYFKSQMVRIQKMLDRGENDEQIEKAVSWLSRQKVSTITLRDLQRGLNIKRSDAQALAVALEDRDLIGVVEVKMRGGKPSITYQNHVALS